MDTEVSLAGTTMDTDAYTMVTMDTPVGTTMDTDVSGNGSINGSAVDYYYYYYTDDTDDDVATYNNTIYIYGIITLTIGTFGLLGNSLSIAVLTNCKMKSSIKCCLIGLAIFDNLLIISQILDNSILNMCYVENTCLFSYNQVHSYIGGYTYAFNMVAQTGSVWLTVLVTIERYIVVCFPLHARSMCTYRQACIWVVVISVFSFAYNIPRFMEYETYVDPSSNDSTPILTATWLKLDPNYYEIYWTWMYLIIVTIVPLVILAVLNGLIWNTIRVANRARQQLSGQPASEMNLTIMLACDVIVFYICNLPDLVNKILLLKGIDITHLYEFTYLLCMANSSVNCIIYCSFGQDFRHRLVQLMCSCCSRCSIVRNMGSSQTDSSALEMQQNNS